MQKQTGFTIVELIIVVVIIAILALISILSFNGVRKNATESLVQDTLKKATTAMLLQNVESGSFATSFPSNVTTPDNVGLALTDTGSSDSFCINVTTTLFDDVQWHSRNGQELEPGLCTEPVIQSSIIGDYNTGGTSAPVTSVGTMTSNGGGFTGTTNADWTNVTLSWDAVSGASRYEVQLRTSPTGTWQLRRIADDATRPNADIASYQNDPLFSARIPSTTTSITWNGPNAVPQTNGGIYEYRVRAYNASDVAGQWFTGSLAVPDGSNLATIDSFTRTPAADWTNLDFAWAVSNNRVPAPAIEIQLRTSPTGTWQLRRIADDPTRPNGDIATYQSDPLFSAMIPIGSTSLNWKGVNALPSAEGQTFEYRIRVKSTTISGLASSWTTISLPAPSLASQPSITGVTVANVPDWSGIVINWNTPNTANTPSPVMEVQLRTSTTGTWMLRRIADSPANSNAPIASYETDPAFSARIPIGTTQINWEGANATPAASQTFEYRVRVRSTTIANLWGDWTTVQLNR